MNKEIRVYAIVREELPTRVVALCFLSDGKSKGPYITLLLVEQDKQHVHADSDYKDKETRAKKER